MPPTPQNDLATISCGVDVRHGTLQYPSNTHHPARGCTPQLPHAGTATARVPTSLRCDPQTTAFPCFPMRWLSDLVPGSRPVFQANTPLSLLLLNTFRLLPSLGISHSFSWGSNELDQHRNSLDSYIWLAPKATVCPSCPPVLPHRGSWIALHLWRVPLGQHYYLHFAHQGPREPQHTQCPPVARA